MKISYFISLAVATAIFTGCGGSSSSSSDIFTPTVVEGTTITVERGPVLKAVVVDANGQIAKEDGKGKYTFTTAPKYPVIAKGGFIDIDRDGVVGIGDVVSDIDLTTTSGSVVTMATTLASNPKTKAELDKISAKLGVNTDDILQKVPSESKEVEAISNVLYKYVKENNITDLLDTQEQKLLDLNISEQVNAEYQFYVSDDTHDFEQNEKDLMDEIANSNSDAINHLDDETEVEDEISKQEEEATNLDVDAIKEELRNLESEYELEHGDIDYEDEGSDVSHNQGVACATCHSSIGNLSRFSTFSDDEDENDNENDEGQEDDENENGDSGQDSEESGSEGDDAENIFTSGATIFTSIDAVNSDATKAASNYSLRLVLEGGTIENYRIGRGTGNVNGTFNAGIAKYTAEVLDRNNNVVNTSVTNSHDASRFDCNSCHTSNGIGGAPGRIVSFHYTRPVVTSPETNTTTPETNTTIPGDTNTTVPSETNTTVPGDTNTTIPGDTNTTTPVVTTTSFASDVLPVLNAKCSMCHGSFTTQSGVISLVDTTNPTSSKLLQKGAGIIGHGGGDQLGGTSSASYITIRDWISEGALDN